MKIVAINSLVGEQRRSAATRRGGKRRERWVLRREFRSTYRDSLMPSEKVTKGRFHTGGSPTDQLPEVSLDAGIASGLLVGLGDTITWDVQGVRVRRA